MATGTFTEAMTMTKHGSAADLKNMTRKIKPYKGGRDDRIYARISKQAKMKLLARVKHEGYKSLADWLEAQAMAQPTKRAGDFC